VRRWHRQLGVVFALPLLWLAVSGLLLRHADRFGLHDRQVRSAWLLQRYGMIPEEAPRGVTAGSRRVVEWGENLFLGDALVQESGVLIGAVPKGRDLVVALEGYLLVYDAGGMLVDQLGDASLPGTPLEALGVDGDGAVMVRTDGKVARIGDDFLGHAEAPAAEVTWSEVTALEEEAIEALEPRLAEQAGISYYRVLLDMHSGNLLGTVTKWSVDLAAIGIIVLTVMGLGLVFRKPRTGTGEG
jgi:hypothetical protein